MKLLEKQILFNRDVVKLLQHAESIGFSFVIKGALRSIDEERKYFLSGKSKILPENSLHVHGVAIDICFFKGDNWINTVSDLRPLGHYWKSLSSYNVWGGFWYNFVDVMHFERRLV